MKDAKALLLEFLAAVTHGQDAGAVFAEDGALELPFLHSLGIPWRHQGRQAIRVLQDQLARLYVDIGFLPEDTIVLITLPGLDRQQVASKWFGALESAGVAVHAGAVKREQLGQWLSSRLAQQGQRAGTETLEFLVSRVEGNLIHQIGNRPAYEVLVETYNNLPPDEQKKCNGNMFVGLVINEYLEEFHRGDFLIRNLMGADPKSGIFHFNKRPKRTTLSFPVQSFRMASNALGF